MPLKPGIALHPPLTKVAGLIHENPDLRLSGVILDGNIDAIADVIAMRHSVKITTIRKAMKASVMIIQQAFSDDSHMANWCVLKTPMTARDSIVCEKEWWEAQNWAAPEREREFRENIYSAARGCTLTHLLALKVWKN